MLNIRGQDNVLVLVHRIFKDDIAKPGGADYIVRYLRDRGFTIYSIEHPLAGRADPSRLLVNGEVRRKFNIPAQAPLGWLFEVLYTVWLAKRQEKRFPLVLAVDPLNFISAYLLRLFRGVDTIWFHSIDYSHNRFRSPWLNKIYRWMYRFAVLQADTVTYVSLKMGELINSFEGKKRGSRYHLPNSPEFDKIPRLEPSGKEPYSLVYTKSFISPSEVERLVRIVSCLVPIFPRLKLHLIGNLEIVSDNFISTSPYRDNFVIHGLVDYKTNLDIMSRALIGIAWYEGNRSFEEYADSLKIREYAASGLVPISNDKIGTAFELAEKGVGIMITDESELVGALRALFSDQGKYLKLRDKALSWAKLMDKATLLRQIITSPSESELVLDLGCGMAKRPGAVGVDSIDIKGVVDVVHDLNVFPYPFAESSVDQVWLIFVLEHLDKPFQVLEEVYRILKPGGKVFIRVPHYSSVYCWGELTHQRAFFYGFWEIFGDQSTRAYYSTARFKVLDSRLKYFLTYPPVKWHTDDPWQPHWEHYFIIGSLVKIAVSIIQFFIDLSPRVFERFWAYYVGGAAEVNCVLQAEKHRFLLDD